MLPVVLAPSKLPEKIPQDGKNSQKVEHDGQDFLLSQFIRCILIDDVSNLPAFDAALQDG